MGFAAESTTNPTHSRSGFRYSLPFYRTYIQERTIAGVQSCGRPSPRGGGWGPPALQPAVRSLGAVPRTADGGLCARVCVCEIVALEIGEEISSQNM
jgi:hypothetical protein